MNAAPMPVIAGLYAGLIALFLMFLATRVSRLRHAVRVGVGDGGDKRLARAIRVHGNAVEWALPVLLLLLIAELNRAPALLLHVCGVALLIGRVMHAVGVSNSSGMSLGRFAGMGITWVVLLALAGWDIWAFARLALV